MRPLKRFILTSAFAASMCLAHDEKAKSAVPENAPTSNPGFGAQVPNDSAAPSTPQANSSYQKDRNGNMGFDLGWLGLAGLAGLFGLARGRGRLERPEGYDPKVDQNRV